MKRFIANLNEGRGKEMLKICVEESKEDYEKIGNQPQAGTQACEGTKSNFRDAETRPTSEMYVEHQQSENQYVLTVCENQTVTAADVLEGEFLFDNSVEVQDYQPLKEITNNNKDYEESNLPNHYDSTYESCKKDKYQGIQVIDVQDNVLMLDDQKALTQAQVVTIIDENECRPNTALDDYNLFDNLVFYKDDDYVIPDEYDFSSDSNDEVTIKQNKENYRQEEVLELEQVQEEPADQVLVINDESKKNKKRLRNEKSWKRNVKKFKVNQGEAYQTKSGNLKQAKSVKAGCGDKCKLKCSETLNLVERQNILSDFLSLTDVNRKRDFISKLMDEVKPKYTYKKDGSHRSTNYSYHFIINSKRVRVCKKMFTDTFCISSTFLTTIKSKTTTTGVVEADRRGKHMNQPKTDPQVIKSIIDHINSFPRIESHYCRADTKREYIDGDLTQAEMYRLYKGSCQEKDIPFAKKHKYEEILNTKFNIGFFVPKKDQCAFCASYKNSSDEERVKMQEDMDNHQQEKKISRQEKKCDKEQSRETDSKVIVCCFDLQAVVQLPKGQISTFYYKRKLNAFDFTIYDASTKQGYCYIWHEGCAKRGSLEIASFIYNYLREYCSGTDKKVVFYSDNCSGQNKNQVLLKMYLYAVKTLNIPSITHKYLIVGHTQNEGDVMHSLIEKQLSLATKKTPLYVPSQLVAVAQVASKGKKPFVVKQMDTQDVLDWKSASPLFCKNFQYSTSGERVVWADVKIFEVRQDNQNTVYYKTSYDQKDMMAFNTDDKVIKKKDGSIVIIPRGLSAEAEDTLSKPRRSPKSRKAKTESPKQSVNPSIANDKSVKQAYQIPPGITVLKKADLLSLCKENLIPRPYHQFFESLRTSTVIPNDILDVSDEDE